MGLILILKERDRESDKKAFFDFIKELSFALKAKGKELTVDSFAYKWNAPKPKLVEDDASTH